LTVVSVLAGLLLGVFSNWLYDLLKDNFFPDKPTVKHFIVVLVFFSPLLVLVILPELFANNESISFGNQEDLNKNGAYIKLISTILPAVIKLSFSEDTPIITDVEYLLPLDTTSPEIDMQYTLYPEKEGFYSHVIHSVVAKKGKNRVRITGLIQKEEIKNKLPGFEGIKISVKLVILDESIGHRTQISESKDVIYTIDLTNN